jgi:hypothetical protein
MTTLSTEGYTTININSTEITLQKGYGFYTTLTAYNPSITLQGNQKFSIDIAGNATSLIRQPLINVNGKIQFEDFYMLHPPTIYTDGRNTTLSGNITLNIYVFDEATIALPYKFNSSITIKYEKTTNGVQRSHITPSDDPLYNTTYNIHRSDITNPAFSQEFKGDCQAR